MMGTRDGDLRDPHSRSVGAIIVNYRTDDLVARALRGLADSEAPNLDIVIVDNGVQTAGDFGPPPPRSRLRVVPRPNTGFADAVNTAAAMLDTREILLLNSDAIVSRGDLARMLEVLDRDSSLAAVAPVHYYRSGARQDPFSDLPTPLALVAHRTLLRRTPIGRRLVHRWLHPDVTFNEGRAYVPQPPASCLLLRAGAASPLMHAELPLYFNDVDLCERLGGRDLRIAVVEDARCEHDPGSSTRLLGDRRVGEWSVSACRYLRRSRGPAIAWLVRTAMLMNALIAMLVPRLRSEAVYEFRALLSDRSIFDDVRTLDPVSDLALSDRRGSR